MPRHVYELMHSGDLTADDDTSKFRELYQDLGVITVKVHRKQRIGTTDPAGISHEMSLQPVPEKGLKGRPLHVATTYGYHLPYLSSS